MKNKYIINFKIYKDILYIQTNLYITSILEEMEIYNVIKNNSFNNILNV